ncbi:MAG: SCO family protein [Pseudomonadota bacterium]
MSALLSTLMIGVVFAAAPLPGESIYQLPVQLTLQDDSRAELGALRGKPVVVTMFYASCDGVCPAIAFSMRRMEKALDGTQRARMQWLMVSFDPARDTPKTLRQFASDNHIESRQWRVARADPAKVRDIAAALNIRYRELPNGVFSHSAEIVLLDANGVIRARTSNLTELDADFMHALREEADKGS